MKFSFTEQELETTHRVLHNVCQMPLERATRRKLQKLRDKFLPGPVVLKPFDMDFLGVVLRPIFGSEIPKSLEEQTAVLKQVWEKVDAARNADTRQPQ